MRLVTQKEDKYKIYDTMAYALKKHTLWEEV